MSKTEWTINGKPRNVLDPECGWIVADPDACASCPLNTEGMELSALMAHILYIENLQAVGAQINLAALSPLEWQALIQVKIARQKAEMKRLSK